ncbi:MAG: Lrp/AsnC family transcriptional regulator [Candidatus Pacearchaeota archaeon]|jgi:DNA-binding Lrp family transcriptional regulator
MVKLDLIDNKILSELDKDARKSCREISKKLRLSPEVINYRIKKLEDSRIITAYTLAVNLSKLNIIYLKILLSFQHLNSEKLDKITEKLKENKSVKWIVSCRGNWDMIISIEANSLKEIELLKNKIISDFGQYINKKAIAFCTEASTFNRTYFSQNNQKKEMIIINSSEKGLELDELDIKIIKKLSLNSRKSLVEIASELKTTARIVNYRMKQLIKKGVITGFRLAIDYSKLNLQFYKLLVYLDNPNEQEIKRFVDYLKNNKNLIHHVNAIGDWDFEPEFEVYSEQEFNEILKQIKDNFSDIIKNIEVITISKEHKFVYF